jgi:type IV pilus assembly protein PilA
MHSLRYRHLQEEDGFTLIELLTVILIIGILAAIAIPSFLNQKSKAYDASAKELARTAETTAETYSTDHEGAYKGMNEKELEKYESSLEKCPSKVSEQSNACLLSAAAEGSGSEGYKLITRAANSGDEFTIKREASGTIVRTCASKEGSKTGCSGSASGSW